MRSRRAERSLALEPTSMESAVPSVKWKTTASAACIPRRDSTSPYSMAATALPTASRIVCSLLSGLGGPIILGCSPLLTYWLSILAPSASCGRLLAYYANAPAGREKPSSRLCYAKKREAPGGKAENKHRGASVSNQSRRGIQY